MVVLTSIGEAITLGINKFIVLCEKRLLKRAHPRRMKTKILVFTLVCIVLTICICSVMTMHTDEFSFQEGLYAWFVTFSTIGFGDYIPFNVMEKNHSDYVEVILFEALTAVPFVFGLCMVAALLSSLLDLITHFRVSAVIQNFSAHIFTNATLKNPANTAVSSRRRRKRSGSI